MSGRTEHQLAGGLGMVGAVVGLVAGSLHPRGYVSAADGGDYAQGLDHAATGALWRVSHAGLIVATLLVAATLVVLVRGGDVGWRVHARVVVMTGAALSLAALALELGLTAVTRRDELGVGVSLIGLIEIPLFAVGVLLFWGLGFVLAGLAAPRVSWYRWVACLSGLTAMVAGFLVLGDGRLTAGSYAVFSVAFTLDLLWLFWMSLLAWRGTS